MCRPGTAASGMGGRVDGAVVRERGRTLRMVGAELTRRFRRAQAGTVRPGLTLEDGTLVVTDNYLKVRIPPGLPRNERVLVRIGDGGEPLRGVVVPPGHTRAGHEGSAGGHWTRDGATP